MHALNSMQRQHKMFVSTIQTRSLTCWWKECVVCCVYCTLYIAHTHIVCTNYVFTVCSAFKLCEAFYSALASAPVLDCGNKSSVNARTCKPTSISKSYRRVIPFDISINVTNWMPNTAQESYSISIGYDIGLHAPANNRTELGAKILIASSGSSC